MSYTDRTKPPPGFDPEGIEPPPLKDGPASIKGMAVDISGGCNLDCLYCQETAALPRRRPMAPDTFEAAWRFLFPPGQKRVRKEFSIHLGSGEPFLNFPLLKRTAQLVEETQNRENVKIGVYITTNATLLDETTTPWLIDSGWNIKVSFDGPPAVHDKWRVSPGGKGTYTQVEKALTRLVEKIPDRVTVVTVLCPGADPADVFRAIEALGVGRMEMVPVAHFKESLHPSTEDIRNYRTFIMDYAARVLEEGDRKPVPVLHRFNQCVMRLMGYQLGEVFCGAGRNYIGVGPEGDIYPCARFIGQQEFRLGHVATGLDMEAVYAFRKGAGCSFKERDACAACWAAPLCAGPCFAFAEQFGPGDHNPVDFHCDYITATAEAAVFLVNRLRETAPERLLDFLPGMDDVFTNIPEKRAKKTSF